MIPDYAVVIEGVVDAKSFVTGIPSSMARVMLRAVNKTTRDGRTLVSRRVRDQVAFTASYLGPNSGRLDAKLAKSQSNPEGRISARARPTSLARFTNEQPLGKGKTTARRRKGVKVTVKPGVARYISDAFVIPLRAGADGALSNRGLAVRSENAPRGAYKPAKLGKNLWLLYGPSVAQVLQSARNNGGVADDVAPLLGEMLERESLRLIDLDLSR